MTVSFRIFPDRGLVVVRYAGFAVLDETFKAFEEYAAHPDYSHGHKHLVDLTELTGYEKDYARIMQIQATKADHLAQYGTQSLIVYLAPTPISQELSALIVRPWEDTDAIVPVIQYNESQALAILGQSETSIQALFAAADRDALQ